MPLKNLDICNLTINYQMTIKNLTIKNLTI